MVFQNKTVHLLIFFLLSISISNASLIYSENIEKAHSQILEFEFSQAQVFLDQEKDKNPDNKYIEYLNNYHLFLDSYFEATPLAFKNFDNYSTKCIDLLKEEKNKEDASLLISMIYTQKAYSYFLWDKHFSYANALMKGQGYLNKIDPNSKNSEYLKLKSIYEVVGGSVPSSYKIYAKWFGFRGSPKKGIELIEEYLNKPDLPKALKTEGQIINLYLRSFLDYNTPEIKGINQPLLAYVYLQTGKIKNTEKIALINKIQQNFKKSPKYLYYLMGKYLLELQNPEGLLFIRYFQNKHKGLSFIHAAQMFKAWYYLANNNRIKFEEEILSLENLKEAVFPADKEAKSRLRKNDYIPMLLKARMLFDAGNYHKALMVLKKNKLNTKELSTEHKIEYLYRLARIYEKTNKVEKALVLYQQVINTEKTHLYFIAYSAYRMGKIYTKSKKQKLAEKFFKKALKLNKGEYKISIEKKSLFALEMLE